MADGVNYILIRHAIIAWVVSGFILITFGFFFQSIVSFDQPTLLLWLAGGAFALSAWRVVFRELLFWQRKQGHNTRSAIVIGATSSGYNLAMEIIQNDPLGIIFKGVYDDRLADRIPHEFSNQMCGTVADAIALAKKNEGDFIYIVRYQ